MDKLSDPGAMVSVAQVAEQTRDTARRKLIAWGDADLLPMLGLSSPQLRGWRAVDCPQCARRAGSGCAQVDGTAMPRPHQARKKAAAHERAGVSGG